MDSFSVSKSVVERRSIDHAFSSCSIYDLNILDTLRYYEDIY